jgi:hypothetical protein
MFIDSCRSGSPRRISTGFTARTSGFPGRTTARLSDSIGSSSATSPSPQPRRAEPWRGGRGNPRMPLTYEEKMRSSTDDTDGHRLRKEIEWGMINRRGRGGSQRRIDISFLLVFLCDPPRPLRLIPLEFPLSGLPVATGQKTTLRIDRPGLVLQVRCIGSAANGRASGKPPFCYIRPRGSPGRGAGSNGSIHG